jgi:hypothetical protein
MDNFSINMPPKYCLKQAYPKNYPLFIYNSNLPGTPLFYLVI